MWVFLGGFFWVGFLGGFFGWVFYWQPCLVVPVDAAAPGAGNAAQHRRFRIRMLAKDRAPEESAAREAAPAPEVNVVRGRGAAHQALLARHRRHLSQKSTRDWVLLRRAVVGRLNCCISGIFRIPRKIKILMFFSSVLRIYDMLVVRIRIRGSMRL